MDRLKLDDLGKLLDRGGLGLVVGPDATIGPHFVSDLCQKIAKEFQVAPEADLFRLVDTAIENGAEEQRIKGLIATQTSRSSASANATALAAAPYSAVVSLAFDQHFDEAFKQSCAKNPLRKNAIYLTDLKVQHPPDTTPIFKVLGSTVDDSVVASNAEYMIRRGLLARVVSIYSDCVLGGPTFCVGVSSLLAPFLDIIAQMHSMNATRPGPLIFIGDEPLLREKRFQALIEKTSARVIVVDATVGEFATAAKQRQRQAASARTERLSRVFDADHASFFKHCEIATLVNLHTSPSIAKNELERLSDILAAPQIAKWDPFAYDLDLPRTITKQLIDGVENYLGPTSGGPSPCIALKGGVSTGKSTVLKRASFDLARKGYTVIWLKANHMLCSIPALREVFQHAREIAKAASRKGVVIVQDDPIAFGGVTPSSLLQTLDSISMRAVILTGYRTSDWQNLPALENADQTDYVLDLSLPDNFDALEWKALTTTLTRLGICPNEAEAAKRQQQLVAREARDALCALHFLIPRTKSGIDAAIRDEYFRLGSAEYLARKYVELSASGADLCQAALELVAVADHYRVPLPLEVLVHALDIDYNKWFDYTDSNDVVWGVLYPMSDHVIDSQCYRTRNAIITDVILRTLNGGSIGRAGEVTTLIKLLAACTNSQPVYREFCARITINNPIFESLSYEDGKALYDVAITSLPYKDRTLLHHEGNWVRRKSDDTELAREILLEALETPDPPYAARRERAEHIHTSLAALGVKELQLKKKPVADVLRDSAQHLEKGRGIEFLNPHAVHVRANTVVKLIRESKVRNGAGETDPYNLAVPSLDDLSRVLLQLTDQKGKQVRGHKNDLDMLAEVESVLLDELGNADFLDARAEQLYQQFNSQKGYVVAARRKTYNAKRSGSGTKFKDAHVYAMQLIATLEKDAKPVDRSLYEVTAHNYYYWRLKRELAPNEKRSITWDVLRDLALGATDGGRDLSSPINTYLVALSFAHLGDWAKATYLFEQLRSTRLPNYVLNLVRDPYYAPDGTVRQVQGKISREINLLLRVDDPPIEVRTERSEGWPQSGEIANATVVFTFARPLARLP